MYQLRVTLREVGFARYEAHAFVEEVLPGGGCAPVAERRAMVRTHPTLEPDPFQALFQALSSFAQAQ